MVCVYTIIKLSDAIGAILCECSFKFCELYSLSITHLRYIILECLVPAFNLQ